MSRTKTHPATETTGQTVVQDSPPHRCPTCADWGGDEVGCDTDCYQTCTIRDPQEGTEDHWRPCNFEKRCPTCAHYDQKEHAGTTCQDCLDDTSAHNWKPAHPDFTLKDVQPKTADTAIPADKLVCDEPDLLTCPPNLHKLGKELITVTQELTDAERLELAGKMANALQRRDVLEEEFTSVKKSYKAKIDLAVEDAATAGSEYRSGERTHTLMCEKYEDKSSLEIVYFEPGTGREISRRKMTDDDRRLKLPMDTPIAVIGTTEPTPDTTRTCITCTHTAQNTDDMPEACQACSQCESGDTDNWEPKKECPTCANSTTRVNLYPCNGCCLNAAADHRGDDDRWQLKEVENMPVTQDILKQGATAEAEDMPLAEVDTSTVEGTEDTIDHNDDMPVMPLSSPDVMPDVRQ